MGSAIQQKLLSWLTPELELARNETNLRSFRLNFNLVFTLAMKSADILPEWWLPHSLIDFFLISPCLPEKARVWFPYIDFGPATMTVLNWNGLTHHPGSPWLTHSRQLTTGQFTVEECQILGETPALLPPPSLPFWSGLLPPLHQYSLNSVVETLVYWKVCDSLPIIFFRGGGVLLSLPALCSPIFSPSLSKEEEELPPAFSHYITLDRYN